MSTAHDSRTESDQLREMVEHQVRSCLLGLASQLSEGDPAEEKVRGVDWRRSLRSGQVGVDEGEPYGPPDRSFFAPSEVHEPLAESYGAPGGYGYGQLPEALVARLLEELAKALTRVAESPGPLARESVSSARAPEPWAEAREWRAPVEARLELPSSLVELREASLSAQEAGKLLGVNSSRIRQRLSEGSLYGFKEGRSWWLPVFQFAGRGTVPGVGEVFPHLPEEASPLAVARWFLTPWADLITDEALETVASPRDWLLEGRDPKPVAAQARVL